MFLQKQILFGFLYIAEAHYLQKTIDSYFTCRPFCLNETICSRLISNTDNPVFDFSQVHQQCVLIKKKLIHVFILQKIPLLYEDELLRRFQDNFMIIEFWEKNETTESVFGLCKIPLNQLYVTYRNPTIVKYLLKNKVNQSFFFRIVFLF